MSHYRVDLRKWLAENAENSCGALNIDGRGMERIANDSAEREDSNGVVWTMIRVLERCITMTIPAVLKNVRFKETVETKVRDDDELKDKGLAMGQPGKTHIEF